jgi:hypothetical protein
MASTVLLPGFASGRLTPPHFVALFGTGSMKAGANALATQINTAMRQVKGGAAWTALCAKYDVPCLSTTPAEAPAPSPDADATYAAQLEPPFGFCPRPPSRGG